MAQIIWYLKIQDNLVKYKDKFFKPTKYLNLKEYIEDIAGSASGGVTDAEKASWNAKQEALVSATNIKTINSNSLLGSGDISISGGLTQQQIEGLV